MAPLFNVSGIASGIDSASLIKAIIDRDRATRVTPLQNQITTLSDTNKALGDLKSKLTAVQSAAAKFRTVNGGILAHTAGSSDESVLTAAVSNSAQNGAYSIQVSNLAKNATYSFRSTAGAYTSTDAKISGGASFSDNVTVKIGDPLNPKDTVSVAVDENTSLSDFVSSFNSQTSDAVASVVNTGTSSSPDYRIVIQSAKTGTAEGQLTVSGGATLQSRGAFDNNTSDAAENAEFTVNGISGTITRPSNTISDIVPGLTLNLKDVGSATVTVGTDASSSSKALSDFVTAYNELVKFVQENDQVTQDTDKNNQVVTTFSPLASTKIDDNSLTSIRQAFSASSLTGGTVNTLADLGVTTQRDGTLAFDSTVFNNALAGDPNRVLQITTNLGERLSAVNGTIAQFVQFGGLIDNGVNANKSQSDSLQKRISSVESALSKQQEALTKQFAGFESLVGRLQSQQNSLSQILPG